MNFGIACGCSKVDIIVEQYMGRRVRVAAWVGKFLI